MKAIFPILLVSILASAQGLHPIRPVIADVARPLPLKDVRLTDGPLKQAQDLDAAYLLRLEPDRMLANFRKRAGLKPKALPYGGWDGDGKNLSGHILGHYLSAISLMGSATGDPKFKARVDYILSELKVVQDKQGDGYLGALEQGKERFEEVARGDIRSGGFDLNGLWSPWYVQHKIYAGLRDAYRYTGNPLALSIEIKFAAWAERTLAHLDAAQLQKMLNTEFGAMNEVLADLYADTGDRRWLQLSYKFEHHAVLDPLKRHQDKLSGLHGNTQVPKLMGNLARYAYTGDPGDGYAASFFWDRVVQHHTFATGGHGKNEYFFDADRMSDSVDGRTAETCNVYNMIKMARKLFALRPDPYYAEFHERALFNHILASMDPQDGRTCYMVPVGRGVQHEYQDLDHDFTCCVGSGMESHALHGYGLYYEAGDRVWVNLYAPSRATWAAAGLSLTTTTDLPIGDQASIAFTLKTPKAFTLNLRRPAWALEGFKVQINGQDVPSLAKAGTYVEITRTWKSGDVVRLLMPKTLRLEPVPDNPRRAAILWGPLVLAGNLGPEEDFETWKEGSVPVLVAAERPLDQWIKPVAGKPGHFRTEGAGNPHEVDLVPFYQLHRRSYAVYFDLFTPKEWQARAAEYAQAAEQQRKLQLATVAYAQPGEMQPERDFNFKGEGMILDEMRRIQGRPFRHSKQWFSFDMPVDAAHPAAVVLTYFQDEWRKRTFMVLVDGQKIADEVIDRGGVPRFFDREYAIPQSLVQGKKTVTVRIEAAKDSETPAIFGVRTIRSDSQR